MKALLFSMVCLLFSCSPPERTTDSSKPPAPIKSPPRAACGVRISPAMSPKEIVYSIFKMKSECGLSDEEIKNLAAGT